MGYESTGVKIPKMGQVNYNTVAGSLGLASFLGLGANGGGGCCGNNGGLLGGLFGGNRNNDCCMETKEASCLREQVSVLQAENFSRQAATQAFTDAVTFANAQNDRQAANIKTLFDTVVTQGVAIQRVSDGLDCFKLLDAKNQEIMQLQLADIRKDIKIEAEKRCCGDNSIVTYSNATFYPKQVASITTGTTTVPQPTYNPLPVCGCCCD